MFLNSKPSSFRCGKQSSQSNAFDWILAVSQLADGKHSQNLMSKEFVEILLTDSNNWDVLCGWSKSKDRDSHGKHKTWQRWTCKLRGSWNWWPRQLEWRGPHRGADQRPIKPRDLAWKVAAMIEGHEQRLHSLVLFCFTPHTHAHGPSIAYWITCNHSIKVTWRSSIRCPSRAAGRWITGAVLLFVGSLKTRCLKCYHHDNPHNLWLRSVLFDDSLGKHQHKFGSSTDIFL